MTLNKRTTLYMAIGAAVVIALILAFRPSALPVETAHVERAAMMVTVEARGQTRAVDSFVVSAPVAGNLERIPFRAGDLVQQGQVVARIAPSSLGAVPARQATAQVQQAEAAVTQAEAALQRARSQSALASSEARRIEALHAQGIASKEQLDQAQTAARSAAHDVQSADAAVRQAQANLTAARAALLPLHPGNVALVELRAPVTSRIFNIPERSGRAIVPGEAIMTLGNPHRIEAVIDLLSQDAVKVHSGNRAWLIDWGGDHPIEGTVKTVESSAFTKVSALGIEEQRVHVIVTIPEPPPTLGDAYRVQGRIEVWSAPNALQVPIGSLVRFGNDWGLYVVDGGRARKRVIRIDHRNEDTAEVLSGLKPGEVVVVHPGDDVSDGVRVRQPAS